MKVLLSFVHASSLLVGCAASGPVYVDPSKPEQGNATVIIYRPDGLAGKAHVHRYFVDHKWMASLRTGGYTSFEVPANKTYLFGLDATTGEVDYFRLTPQAGRKYYVRDKLSVASSNVRSDGGGMNTLSMSFSAYYGVASTDTAPSDAVSCRYNAPLTKLAFEGF